MRRALATLALLALLGALAGCGSSSKTSSGTEASSGTGTSSGTGASAGTGASSGAGAIATQTPRAGLKVNGKPRYGSPPASAPVQSGTVNIAYRNIAIHPDTLKVKVGTTIRWTNYDPVEHNVTSEGGPQHFASKDFGEGQSFSIKVTKPGVIHYMCTIHPTSMNGTIVVVR
jgi:plastocyanin